MADGGLRTKLLAGAGLVCVSTSVGVLYKLSQAASGGFKYSTTSAVCMAECIKFCMSCSFHVMDKSHREPGKAAVASAIKAARTQLSPAAVLQILILSFLYSTNNQLSFFVYTLADPGTIFLFKSGSTLIVAIVQTSLAGKSFSFEQWKAMALQSCGMVIVQYDPCKASGMYSATAYACMSISTAITATCAARNEHMLKNYAISMHVQNAVLYAGGAILNFAGFCFIPNPSSSQAIGFFDGYDNIYAILVVAANSVIGIVITAVYKYADAVVKCIASDVTAVLLIVISVFGFGVSATITMWCGVFVVIYAVHQYIDASKAPPRKVPQSPPPVDSQKEGPSVAPVEQLQSNSPPTAAAGKKNRKNDKRLLKS
eukprot:TRINITY_DN59593_c0_g1_i1.p1 TRINITY_DN59593_c0_g1~~TRINITY_DN59593_c0_g1_i1.p1  ORF type:complete len:371 (+),score=61.98 TRINITY_DN59593_c0_g1_i1:61-1173(+)